MVGAKPLQPDQRRRVDDPSLVEPAEHLGDGRRDHPDVLVLVVETMDSADVRGIDPARVEQDHLAGHAGGDQEATDELQLGDLAAGFLDGLALGDRFRGLALVDDAGDDLHQPRRRSLGQPRCLAGGEGADAELLDQYQGVEVGIVEDHADRVTALQHLAAHRLAPAAGEQAVTEPEGLHPVVSLERDLVFEDLDVVGGHAGLALRWDDPFLGQGALIGNRPPTPR